MHARRLPTLPFCDVAEDQPEGEKRLVDYELMSTAAHEPLGYDQGPRLRCQRGVEVLLVPDERQLIRLRAVERRDRSTHERAVADELTAADELTNLLQSQTQCRHGVPPDRRREVFPAAISRQVNRV